MVRASPHEEPTMIRRCLSMLLLSLVIALPVGLRADEKPAARQVEKRYEKGKLNYLLFTPEGYDSLAKAAAEIILASLPSIR